MFTRTTGLLIVPLWLAAMSWLIAHDVLPGWTALDPPALRVTDPMREDGGRVQFTLSSEDGPLGRIWTSYLVDEDSIRRDDLILIDRLPLHIAPLRIGLTSVFTGEGVLDEFTAVVENRETRLPIKLHGERFHADFSFTLQTDAMTRAFKMPLVEGGLVSGAFNPFSPLADLRVGQSWRMHVFNPIAALTGLGDRFIPVLVHVVGEGRIKTADWEGNCLVLEAGSTRAWVDAEGAVRVQEMTLPMLGQLRIVRDARFDHQAYAAAKRVRLAFGRPDPT